VRNGFREGFRPTPDVILSRRTGRQRLARNRLFRCGRETPGEARRPEFFRRFPSPVEFGSSSETADTLASTSPTTEWSQSRAQLEGMATSSFCITHTLIMMASDRQLCQRFR
jgi:hypothetical protein